MAELRNDPFKNAKFIGYVDDFTPEQLREIFSRNKELLAKARQNVPIANNNKPTTQEDSPKTSIKEALGWGSVHGLTLGYDDEIAAGVSAAVGKEKYDDVVKRRRDYQKLLAKEHPYAYYTGNVVGGLVTLVPAIVGGPVVAGGAAIGRGALAAARCSCYWTWYSCCYTWCSCCYACYSFSCTRCSYSYTCCSCCCWTWYALPGRPRIPQCYTRCSYRCKSCR
ncbi:hypothetical protein [Bartonella schoenbuchensis]|uniref:hypothetical protein n=1 Tax=Bartonella schoenbuchensis TaxID=165694 RepID=UPI003145582C